MSTNYHAICNKYFSYNEGNIPNEDDIQIDKNPTATSLGSSQQILAQAPIETDTHIPLPHTSGIHNCMANISTIFDTKLVSSQSGYSLQNLRYR